MVWRVHPDFFARREVGGWSLQTTAALTRVAIGLILAAFGQQSPLIDGAKLAYNVSVNVLMLRDYGISLKLTAGPAPFVKISAVMTRFLIFYFEHEQARSWSPAC